MFGFRLSAKKRRDIFVLKAISNAHRSALGFAITDVPIDLRTIEGLIAAAQLTEAGCHTGDSCYIEPLVEPQHTAPYERQLKKVAWKYGLPSLGVPDRLKRIEAILLEMPDKLKWHPPDKWSIK